MMVDKIVSRGPSDGSVSDPFRGTDARRQLHISLGLVTMLAIGIVSAATAVGGHPLAVKHDVVASRTPVTAMQAETRVTGAKPI